MNESITSIKEKMSNNQFIYPNWDAPKNILAMTTTRANGFSKGEYSSFNLSLSSKDDSKHVTKNRNKLKQQLNLPNEPCWLSQTHSTNVINGNDYKPSISADGLITTTPNTVCAILTADCIPILICSRNGDFVGAIHAGWQGLLNGIIEKAIKKSNLNPSDIIAWVGPSISQKFYEVQQDFMNRFINNSPEYIPAFSKNTNQDSWQADLKLIAKLKLEKLSIPNIYISPHCTYTEEDLFFSYRRDSETGRIATLIWFEYPN